MTTFLTFQLYGPMASWGEVAVGEERDTELIPTRSAVLGLCAAALGIPRSAEDDILELNDSLGFAVCVRHEGRILRDYHTVESPAGKRARDLQSRRKELEYHNTGTMLSKRHYTTDGYYIVSLWARRNGEDALSRLHDALNSPKFSLYLGRKSCPLALPLAPMIGEFDSLRAAVESYPVDVTVVRSNRFGNERARIAWDADAAIESGFALSQTSTRWDRLISRQRWQFTRRQEALASAALKTEVRR